MSGSYPCRTDTKTGLHSRKGTLSRPSIRRMRDGMNGPEHYGKLQSDEAITYAREIIEFCGSQMA